MDFRLDERDDVRFKAAGSHAAFARLSAFAINGDPARMDAYAKLALAEIETGAVEVLIGKRLKEPGALESLHDLICRITRPSDRLAIHD